MGVAVIQEAEKKGILGVLYEARLGLGKAEMKHGNKEDGRARLAEVERIERAADTYPHGNCGGTRKILQD